MKQYRLLKDYRFDISRLISYEPEDLTQHIDGNIIPCYSIWITLLVGGTWMSKQVKFDNKEDRDRELHNLDNHFGR